MNISWDPDRRNVENSSHSKCVRMFTRCLNLKDLWWGVAVLCLACGGTTHDTDPNGGASAGAGAGAGASAGAGAGAGAGQVAGTIAEGDSQSGSWNVHSTVEYLSPNTVPAEARCTESVFTANLSADRKFVTLSQAGRVSQMGVTLAGGMYMAHDATVDLSLCPGLSGLSLSSLTLAFGDASASAIQGTLTGVLEGSVSYSGGGDIAVSQAVRLALTGEPDTMPPTLLTPTGDIDPFGSLVISASAPLTADSTVAIGVDRGAPIELVSEWRSPDGAPPVAIRYESEPNLVLPFFGPTKLLVSGTDLIGNHLIAPTRTVHTLGDPGLLTQGDFETASLIGVSGPVQIASGRGTVPAINGNSSLWLESGAATFHLQSAGLNTHLRFSIQAFAHDGLPENVAFVGVYVKAGIPGSVAATAAPTFAVAPSLQTGDETWPLASGVEDVSVPLEATNGADVYLRIALGRNDPTGGYSGHPAVQIDHVRLE